MQFASTAINKLNISVYIYQWNRCSREIIIVLVWYRIIYYVGYDRCR